MHKLTGVAITTGFSRLGLSSAANATSVNLVADGFEIFSGQFGVQDFFGNNATPIALNIASSVVFRGITVKVTPEPGTIALLGFGCTALVVARRRRRRG